MTDQETEVWKWRYQQLVQTANRMAYLSAPGTSTHERTVHEGYTRAAKNLVSAADAIKDKTP